MAREPRFICEKYRALKSDRSTWENHWQECYEFMLPRKATVNLTRHPGSKVAQDLFDNSAMHAAQLLSNALHSLLTNPNSIWFELSTGDFRIDSRDDVRFWMQNASKRIFDVLNNTNFQTEIHENYHDLVIVGTSSITIEEDDETVVRFGAKPIDRLVIEENSKGQITGVYREFMWTADKIKDKFGEEGLHRTIKESLARGGREKFKIIHAVYDESFDHPLLRMPFTSQYILVSEEEDLMVEGFTSNPYIVSRFYKTAGEIYGRSPGMVALPDAKTLNKMDETVLKGAQKTVDPPLQAPDDGFILPIVTRPGGLNFYRSGSQDTIKPIFNDARIDFGFQAMAERRVRIRQAFFVDQLQLQEGPQKTATEVIQRTEESMRLLGPLIARQQQELLRPLITRVMDIMFRRNMFDRPPAILEGRNLDVNYSSLIAKAQRIQEGQNILRGLEAMTPFLNIDQDARDVFDGDKAVQIIAKMFSWPQEILRTEEDIGAVRQARAQAQEELAQEQRTAQDAQNANQVAGVMKAI